ncbi:response regulator [Deinococcus peraridilitoris]|uniref:Response regulator with CheY-like receiver domain and winged-helix DNA-binding domain protein n=1 Tax=Deinococcus peraridilitoris (strain DSM 19664 / LMG 22246 / CIP 109416 / KR-200) TaxID=937777 RepID=K9ZX27_DEIPD|nr:response regulator [Deinococcus peraridilitoris]AFZ66198.1 response regulator with CheY-like receiver domain and winged-helix DNA-binding domain protein [Deinococcus peraridilitoris DSM 19664]
MAAHRILLVEDNELDIELAQLVFQERGLDGQVAVARDGQEALDYLRRRGVFESRPEGHPALVLLDLNMPRVSGFQVLSSVKNDPDLRHVPIVVFSTSKVDRTACEELGADDYVPKPSSFEAFLSTMQDLTNTWLDHLSA